MHNRNNAQISFILSSLISFHDCFDILLSHKIIVILEHAFLIFGITQCVVDEICEHFINP